MHESLLETKAASTVDFRVSSCKVVFLASPRKTCSLPWFYKPGLVTSWYARPPCVSFAQISGRKNLAGSKPRPRKASNVEGGTVREMVNCTIGDHAVYLLIEKELAFLCVTDGFPVDAEVLTSRT